MAEQYTPEEDRMRACYRLYGGGDTFPENDAEFDRFLARVRRDAAREALDGLAAELMEAARDCAADGDHSGAGAWRNASAHTYHHRDTHYPETETPLRAALDS